MRWEAKAPHRNQRVSIWDRVGKLTLRADTLDDEVFLAVLNEELTEGKPFHQLIRKAKARLKALRRKGLHL